MLTRGMNDVKETPEVIWFWEDGVDRLFPIPPAKYN